MKGHQDINKNRDTIYSPFHRPVQFNIDMDKYAGLGVRMVVHESIERSEYYKNWLVQLIQPTG